MSSLTSALGRVKREQVELQVLSLTVLSLVQRKESLLQGALSGEVRKLLRQVEVEGAAVRRRRATSSQVAAGAGGLAVKLSDRLKSLDSLKLASTNINSSGNVEPSSSVKPLNSVVFCKGDMKPSEGVNALENMVKPSEDRVKSSESLVKPLKGHMKPSYLNESSSEEEEDSWLMPTSPVKSLGSEECEVAPEGSVASVCSESVVGLLSEGKSVASVAITVVPTWLRGDQDSEEEEVMEKEEKAEAVKKVKVTDMAEVAKKVDSPVEKSVQEQEAARVTGWLEEGCREPQDPVRTLPGAIDVRQVT